MVRQEQRGCERNNHDGRYQNIPPGYCVHASSLPYLAHAALGPRRPAVVLVPLGLFVQPMSHVFRLAL
jgi:hypothetical protein